MRLGSDALLRLATSLCAVLAHAPVARADVPPISLEEVLRRALERAPEAQVVRARIGVARAERETAGTFPNPALTIAGARSEPRMSGAVAFRLPILGQRQALEASSDREVERAGAEETFQLWQLRHDVRLAYYAVARAEDELAIAQEVEALTRKVATMAEERFSIGAGNRLEEEQAALVHVRAEQDVSDRRAAGHMARLTLARLIAEPPEQLPALRDALAAVGETPPLDRLLTEARARHPEIAALVRARTAAEARAAAARADRVPVPTLEVGAELLEPGTCGGNTRCLSPRGALSFDLPVLNQNAGPIARAEAETAIADREIEAAVSRVESAVRAAHTAFEAARRRAQFFEDRYVPAANRVEAMAREGFSEGKTGLLPLLEAERALLEARLGRSDALYDVQAARADLEESSGVQLSTP